MAITVQPKNESGDLTIGDNGSYAPEYLIFGTDSEDAASAALWAEAPHQVTTQTGHVLVLKTVSVQYHAPDVWSGTANYGPPETKDKEPGESSFSFDTSGGTQHVTQSLATVGNYAPAGQTAPDFKGAIGVTKDAVEGVDITVPVYSFSETYVFADADVTLAYRGVLFALTGKVNNAAFKGCAAGECLFLGASGSKRGDGDWEISFKFAASPNKTNITVGDITVPAKKGWEYLWVRYEDKEDANAKILVKRPLSAHIEKVYSDGDFSQLGIGT
ncbi:MAG: hypothetical protein BIFFINMI_02010 [Phycisphaerae bacterium]|nr:hypothetical protein [Phycisphaerae bacterium]